MDNTQDWMDDVTEILDQYAANERQLQGLPPEDKPKDSEGEPIVSGEEAKSFEISDHEAKDSDAEPKITDKKADTTEVQPEVKELDEDDKEKLRKENKNLVEEFVVRILQTNIQYYVTTGLGAYLGYMP